MFLITQLKDLDCMIARRLTLLCLSCLLAIGALAGFTSSASAAPTNDNFADAELVEGVGFYAPADFLGATRETSEPTVAGSDTAHTVWFRWIPKSDGFLRVSGCGVGYSSVPLTDFSLGIYTGNAVGSLSQLGQGSASCSINVLAQTNVVPVEAGTTYYVQAGHATSNPGVHGELEFDFATTQVVNDDWDDATVVSPTLPQSISSSNSLATVTNESDLDASRIGANSVWYSWTPAQSGTVAIDTCSSSSVNQDSIVEVFDAGAEPVALDTLSSVRYDDDGCNTSGNLSFLTTEVTSGTQYWIRVGNYGENFGMNFTLKLRWVTGFTNLVAPTLDTTAVEPSYNAYASEGNWWSPNEIDYSFQWQRCDAVGANCADIPGATDDEFNVREEDVGYTLRFSVTADDGEDTIGMFSNTSFPVDTTPINDSIADAIDLGASAAATLSQTNVFASTEDNEMNSSPEMIYSTVWFKWTSPGTGNTTIGTCLGAGTAPMYPLAATVGVYTGYDGVSVDNATRVTSASNNCGGDDHGASVQFNATAGTTYWIQVGSTGNDWGQFTLRINGVPGAGAAAPPAVVTAVDPFPAAKLAKLGTIKVKKGKITLKKLNLTCGPTATGSCTGSLTIKTAKKKVKGKTVKAVSQSFKLSVKPGAKAGKTFKLNKKMLAAIKKAKKLKATVTVKLGAPGFSKKTGKTSATLKR